MFFSSVKYVLFLVLIFSAIPNLYAEKIDNQHNIKALVQSDLGLDDFLGKQRFAVFDCRVEDLLNVRVTHVTSGHGIPDDNKPWRQIECYHGEALYSNEYGQLRCVQQRKPVPSTYFPFDEAIGNKEVLWRKDGNVLRLSAMCQTPNGEMKKARLVYNKDVELRKKLAHLHKANQQNEDNNAYYRHEKDPQNAANAMSGGRKLRKGTGNTVTDNVSRAYQGDKGARDVIHQELPKEWQYPMEESISHNKKNHVNVRSHASTYTHNHDGSTHFHLNDKMPDTFLHTEQNGYNTEYGYVPPPPMSMYVMPPPMPQLAPQMPTSVMPPIGYYNALPYSAPSPYLPYAPPPLMPMPPAMSSAMPPAMPMMNNMVPPPIGHYNNMPLLPTYNNPMLAQTPTMHFYMPEIVVRP